MGVPSLYRWLLESFPRAVVDASEKTMEFDNLYLDMNGIIHPCFHPEGLPAPKTYEEVFQAVFKYIDAVFSVVRPRKLLYLAIDGVAPRAKMNQQRSRRFRAAKEAAEEAAQREELGVNVAETQENSICLEQSGKLDSNVITPGTEFMALLSSALQYYIRLRMNKVPMWQQVKVLLSDASVPGEGEHKIMSYIRLQRNLPGYDPNTRHCLYGLDADLIMLALTTHEIHFSILREDIRQSNLFPKHGRDSSGRTQQDVGGGRVQRKVVNKKMEDYISRLKFQFLHVWILREYLAYAMKIPDRTVKVDLERLIDDFVLMCLFVGNDFLPHVPSLEISEGAIDLLMEIYKKEFVRMGGYLTNSFKVNLGRMKHFLEAVGSHEGGIFRKRMQIKKARDVMDERFSRKRKRNTNTSSVGGEPNRSASLDKDTGVDKIKYGELGWKERYYAEKFEAETEDDRERIQRDVVLKYTEGICWVMHYYYQGVCSWQWFYPYHYAPPASDFHGIENLKIQFTLGQPFKPFDQLMAVLPSASAHALPLFYRKLMTETSSPLLALYPTDFELDMNGKRFSSQAICKLPFIEESLLLSEIARVEHTLTDEERQRNSLGFDILFIHISQPLAEKIVSFCEGNTGHPKLPMGKQKIDPKFSGGMNGYMFISDKPVQPEQIDSPIDGMQRIANNEVLSVFYGCPPFHTHFPRPPEEVDWPKTCIRKKDIKPKLHFWHEHTAVVGRLHCQMPVQKSIFGSRLAKLARQLVLTWCHEKQQKSTGSLERGEGASAHDDYFKINIPSIDPPSDKNCTQKDIDLFDRSGQSDKRVVKGEKRKRKNKKKKGRKLSDRSMGVNGMALISSLQEKASAHDTGDDKGYINGRSDKQAVVVTYNIQGGDELAHQLKLDQTGGYTISIDGGSGKHKWEQKWNEGNIVPIGHAEGLSCYANFEKRICADGTLVEETVADESRKEAVGAPDNSHGGDNLTLELRMDQTVGVKSSIDDESGKHEKKRRHSKENATEAGICGSDMVPSEHEGTDEIPSHMILEKGICADEAQGEKTVAIESSEQAIGVPDNNQRREESTFQWQVDQTAKDKSSIHEGTDGLFCHMDLDKGNCVDECQDEKTVVDESRKEDGGVPDNNQGGDKMKTELQRDNVFSDKCSIDGGSGKPGGVPDNDQGGDKMTTELQQDKLLSDKCSIDGGSGKPKKKRRRNNRRNNIIPIVHEGTDGGVPEKPVAAESSKQAIGVTDNIVGGVESTILNLREAVYTTPTVTNGNSMDSRRGEDGDRLFEDGGVPDNNQGGDKMKTELQRDNVFSDKCSIDGGSGKPGGVPDNDQGGDKMTTELQQDKVFSDKCSIDGGSGKPKKKRRRNNRRNNIIPIVHEGTDGGVPEKPVAAESSKQAIGVTDNIVGGVESTVLNLREAVYTTPTVTNGNSMDSRGSEDGDRLFEDGGVPDNNQGGDKMTTELQRDKVFSDKCSIDGGSGKPKKKRRRNNKRNNIIPIVHEGTDGLSSHMNFEEGICADEARGENTMAVESSKQAIGVTDNIVGGVESTILNLREAVYTTPTVTNSNSMDSRVGEDGDRLFEDGGVPDNNQGGDKMTTELQRDKVFSDKCSIDGGSGRPKKKRRQNKRRNNIIPIEHEGTDGLSSHLHFEEGICADEARGEKTMAVESSKQATGVIDNIVGGVESTILNLGEAVYTTPTVTNGNSMDSRVGEDGDRLACHLNPKEMVLVDEPIGNANSKSQKRRQRRKRKKGELEGNVIKPNDPNYRSFNVLDNNLVVKDSTAIQIT